MGVPVMQDPIQFIGTGDNGTELTVNPEALKLLRLVEKPLEVVSVVGLYRTGKSFLLNLLMDRMDGFPLGATVEAKTKGIWMWVGDHPKDPKKALLLLDTEGLHDPEKGSRTHDAHIFTIAVLLSSVLVYNSKGTIDAAALDVLHLATELTNHISTKADTTEETGEDFAKFFPSLVWCVRDHHLSLEWDGKPITSDQYLEHTLALKKGHSKEIRSANDVKQTIRDFFQNRHCFVFPMPTDQDKLNTLDKMLYRDLNEGFRKSGELFGDFVLKKGGVKLINGKEVLGGMFATLTEKYVDAIRTGKICIQSAYDYLIETENTRAMEKALELYRCEMLKLSLPVPLDAINRVSHQAQAKATEVFLQTAVNSEKNLEYSKKLNEMLQEEFKQLSTNNMRISFKTSRSILENLYAPIRSRLERSEFTRPGGHQQYKSLVDDLEVKFGKLKEEETGPNAKAAMFKFREDIIERELNTLLQTDKALSEEQKVQEQLKNDVENAERMKAALEQRNETLQKQKQEMQKSFEENLLRQKEEFERQHQQDMAGLKEHMQKTMDEKERLMKEGFEAQAKLMDEELKDTKEEMKRRAEEQMEKERRMREEMDEKLEKFKKEEEERTKKMNEMMQQLNKKKKKGFFGHIGAALDGVVSGVGSLFGL